MQYVDSIRHWARYRAMLCYDYLGPKCSFHFCSPCVLCTQKCKKSHFTYRPQSCRIHLEKRPCFPKV